MTNKYIWRSGNGRWAICSIDVSNEGRYTAVVRDLRKEQDFLFNPDSFNDSIPKYVQTKIPVFGGLMYARPNK